MLQIDNAFEDLFAPWQRAACQPYATTHAEPLTTVMIGRGGMRNVQDHQAQRVTAEKHISESERRERAIETIDCDLGRSVVMQTDRVYITAFSRSLP